MPPRADAVRNRARILEVAARVFGEHGAAASTEQVAAEAGVAIGTVFRHFPTKPDLLAAIMKDSLAALAARVSAPDATLAGVFTALVAEAAAKRAIIDLLPAAEKSGPGVAEAILQFRTEVAALLTRAKEQGDVRSEVAPDEVMALLVALCQGASRGGWPAELQHRTVAVVLRGLAA